MSTLVVEFRMVDFFSRLTERYGHQIDIQWSPFEPEGYDRERTVDRQCSDCDLSLYEISVSKNETNDKGIDLTAKNVLIAFEWGWSDLIDELVKSQIEEVIEKTLNLKSILADKENYTLHEIVCCKQDLSAFKANKDTRSQENKLYAIYYKSD